MTVKEIYIQKTGMGIPENIADRIDWFNKYMQWLEKQVENGQKKGVTCPNCKEKITPIPTGSMCPKCYYDL
jgi:gluconate kinase